jgi:hypothetical protein
MKDILYALPKLWRRQDFGVGIRPRQNGQPMSAGVAIFVVDDNRVQRRPKRF